MARIYLSPLIVDIRGKQSDTVFSKWRGINYIRSRVVPANPNTAAQQAVRNSLKQLVAMWQDSYDAMKLNNNFYASGKGYSGFNRFVGANVIDNRDGNLLDICLENGYDKVLTFITATGTLTKEIDLTFTPTPVPAGMDMEVHCREVGAEGFDYKTVIVTTSASPVAIALPKAATLYEVYVYLRKIAAAAGDEVGDDLSDTATSQT